MQRRPVSQTLSKVLDISNGTAQVVPDLLKAFSILSDTTVRRSSVDREDLKQNWKQKKRRHFSRWSTTVLFTSLLFTLKERLKNIYKLKNLTPSGLNQDFNQFQVMQFIVYLVSLHLSHCIMAEDLSWHHSLLAKYLQYSCKF